MVHTSMLENIAWSGHSCSQYTLIGNTSQSLYQTWHCLNYQIYTQFYWNKSILICRSTILWIQFNPVGSLKKKIVLAHYMLRDSWTLKTKLGIEFPWYCRFYTWIKQKNKWQLWLTALTFDLFIITTVYKSKFLTISLRIVWNAKEYITLFFR